MKQIFLFSILSLCFSLISCTRNERLDAYECSSAFAANSCANECKKIPDYQYEFMVNKSNNTILQIYYYQGKQAQSSTSKSCTIFDEKNWDCSSKDSVAHISFNSTEKMVNGIYTQYSEQRNTLSGKSRFSMDSFSCAK